MPSFGFRMIRLLVYCVQNKNRNFGCSAWFYIFYWKVKWVWNFLNITSVQFFLERMRIPKNYITCLSCLKKFSKREAIGKLCIEEVRVDLEHLCSWSRKQCRIFHGSLSLNNYPLVYIHCIIKIMCQTLVLGWLDSLFTMCRTKTETLAVARDFTFFTRRSNGSETFCTLLL